MASAAGAYGKRRAGAQTCCRTAMTCRRPTAPGKAMPTGRPAPAPYERAFSARLLGTVPKIGHDGVVVAGNKILGRPSRCVEHMPAHCADVCAIHMDAD